ncbi:hypothetical protein ApAK_05285 [Thermoplasmatales archaeon AK]|nr:hypothetical protein [Thermoplasmatales archaeon AK]
MPSNRSTRLIPDKTVLSQFAIVMSAEAASISAFYHGLISLSLILMYCGLAVFSHVCIFSIVYFATLFRSKDMTFSNMVPGHFSLFSSVFALAIRYSLSSSDTQIVGDVVTITLSFLVIAAILFFYRVRVEKLSTFSSHHLGVAFALGALAVSYILHPLAIFAKGLFVISVILYLIVSFTLLLSVFRKQHHKPVLEWAFWIQFGLASLIALNAYSLGINGAGPERNDLLYLFFGFWILSTALIPLMLALTVRRVLKDEKLLDSSAWAIIFPLSIYSTTTAFVSNYFLNSLLYEFSLGVDLVADILWFLFALLFATSYILTIRNRGNAASGR